MNEAVVNPPGIRSESLQSSDQTADGERISVGLFRRGLAWLVDATIIGIVGFAARAIVGDNIGIGIQVIFLFAYYGLLESGHAGQTIGKRFLHIRVVNLTNDSPLGIRKALLRRICWTLSAIPAGAGFIWKKWDANGLTWHDRIVRTAVVQTSRAAIST